MARPRIAARRQPVLSQRSVRLAVALLAATGAGAAATPAAAEWDDRWTPDQGVLSGWVLPDGDTLAVQTFFEVRPEQVAVTVAPSEGYEATGAAVSVPVEFDAELDAGHLDITDARLLLDEGGAGDVLFTLLIDGQREDAIAFGPDADLTDDTAPEELWRGSPHTMPLEAYPEQWSSVWLLAPGEDTSLHHAPLFAHHAEHRLVQEPEHGDLRVVHDQWGPVGFGYRADGGFTGTDTAVIEWTADGQTKTERVTIHVGDQRAEEFAFLLPPADSSVWEGTDAATLWDAEDGDATDPDHHEVPEKVQTGDSARWWLAGLAAVGAGALVTARRAFAVK